MSSDRLANRLGIGLKLACLCILVLVAAPLATRFGLLSYTLSLPLFALAIVLAAILLLAALAMLPWRRFASGRGRLLQIAALALVPVVSGALIMVPASAVPVIHDISTDIVDPPVFNAVVPLRGAGSNPLTRDAQVDAQQQAGYHALAGMESTLDPASALQRAENTARALGWNVIAVDSASGTLEASETTLWFGFTDDVVVRVRATAGGSLIDLRSVSRVGHGDLGANARRIQRFLAAFQAP
jgi:uncharacterized protein (DUF1499 family)